MVVLINIISQIILKDGACQRINNENQNTTPRGKISLTALKHYRKISYQHRIME
ncbi:hypothetical protein NP493_1898g00007 [Ridgeia piscesae]|uniref:Uncharacterized protein n=1 Tax=Ridgeia piscesae TaxID=27915 RepID=A0AAD9JRD4_RIDPI|nr:hypothetical protein NP493_1898g00007 [Ridgeia piscesae]